MPKDINLQRYLREYGDVFSTDGDILFCKVCSVKVNAEKKFTVTQHLKTNKHEMLAARRKVESKSSEYTQQLFTASNKKSVFSKDLCKALMTAKIFLCTKFLTPNSESFLKSTHYTLFLVKVL